jgi:exopolysaccharide biosynthesis polyprenyl glycosylphosphotransferase
MSHRARVLLALLTAATDTLMAVVALYCAYRLRASFPFPSPLKLGPFRNYLEMVVIQIFSLLAIFIFYRLYYFRRGRSRVDLFYAVVSAVSLASVVSTALSYLFYHSERELTRGMIIYGWFFSVIFISLSRILVERLQRYVCSRHPDRLLLVGTGDVARTILQKTLQAPELGYRVIGFVNGHEASLQIAGVPLLGTQAELPRILQEHNIQEVVIALPEASHDELVEMISACESQRATVRIFPDLFQIIASEVSISDLDGLPLVTVRDVALRGWKLTIKRAMDIVVSGLGLVFMSPLLMLVALIIRIDSKGSVFYAQTRVGLDGRPFPMLKFRSMRSDAEKDSGPVWASAGDPRRTHVGAFLRRTSIDEWPQLINVLLGDMSLVGPRPERPVFVEQFKQVVPRYMDRHKEKAGITGWAQVNGLRGDTSIIERTKYDLYYIENWSLLFDLKILLRTMLNQLRGDRNAY